MVQASAREQRIKDLQQSVALLEGNIAQRNAQMAAEVDQLKYRAGFARNNLAGATYQQGLATEMQAVVAKYQALNAADQDRIRVLRVDLEATQRLPGGR